MATINFNKPSKGEVSSLTSPALTITNKGVGIKVTNSSTTAAVVGIANGNPVTPGPGPAPAILGISNYGGDGIRGETSGKVKVVAGTPPGAGVRGEAKLNTGVGVVGLNTHGGTGILGIGETAGRFEGFGIGVSARGTTAGQFEGNVEVSGNIQVKGDISLSNADCAEDFDILEENVEAGTVMVLNEEGGVEPSLRPYDSRAAGVISGAGDYKPAIVLDRGHSPISKRIPVALMGKVYCKVDANYSSISVGDLLTTSGTRGHAMKAADPVKAFGAVIGKALRPLAKGSGLIPILVTLQ